MNIIKDNKLIFRLVEKKDWRDVYSLLNQLTELLGTVRDKDECWDKFISNNSNNAIVGLYNNQIIAYGSIVIENKIRGELAGHIEDIVVDRNFRDKNIGVKLIKKLVKIGYKKDCYRITLTCDQSLINFYSKNGFNVNNIAMKKHL
jgi:glucosamine-phosphate N-acetyltransferase|tara:strand:+ start:7215 stop:7652 length:438 start_codon:yes stop_codon:yes gene_type:complete